MMATTPAFTANDAIKYGWKTTTGRFWFFAGVFLSVWAVQFFTSQLADSLKSDQEGLAGIIMLIAWVLQIGLSLGTYTIVLRTVTGHKPEYKELFSRFEPPLMLKYFVSSLLVGVIVLIGLLLLIIPGFIFAIRLGFFSYLMIDKKLGPVEAIKESWNMTKGHLKELSSLMLFLIGINILGFALFGIGLVLTVPLSMLASGYAYHKLAAK